jgi:hypothetical protein
MKMRESSTKRTRGTAILSVAVAAMFAVTAFAIFSADADGADGGGETLSGVRTSAAAKPMISVP